MKVGAENKTQVRIVIALVAILALVAIYNLRGSIWGSSAAAPPASAPAQQKNAPGGLPAQDSSDPRLRTDILDASRKVKYEAGNRNPFAMGAMPLPTPIAPVVTSTPTPVPTPPPPPPIPLKYYGLVSKPGEPKRIFLKREGEGKEQVYISKEGDIVDRRYRVVQIQPTSVLMEDVLTGNRQPIQVEPLLQPGGR